MLRKFVLDGTASSEVKTAVAAQLHKSFDIVRVTVATSAEVLDDRAAVSEVTLTNALLVRIDDAARPSSNTLYFYRFFWVTNVSTAQEVSEDFERSVLRGDGNQFVSTRGSTTASVFAETGPRVGPATFLAVVRDGLAADGGLFFPTSLRPISASQWQRLIAMPGLDYRDVAQTILERLSDPNELPPGVLESFVSQAYNVNRWADPKICPLTPLLKGECPEGWWDTSSKVKLLELYHGPTAAFKDFALQLFPYFFSFSTNGLGRFMILAATSGDTGVAAIVGFLNSAPDTKVMVLYPDHGVSPVQKIQMQACDDGTTVRTFGVNSDFDYCQTTVKHIFQSKEIALQLDTKHHVTLSSANSINYGRLIPQVVYYAFAYRELVQSKTIQYGDIFDVCVPCGNFGNILSCFIAKKLGLPVRRMVVASNENDVLCDFIQTGVYDISQRSLHVTASPSIDILKASNIERLLYFIADGDTIFVKQCMQDLQDNGKFALPQKYVALLHEVFTAERCSEEECSQVMHDVYNASNGQRLLDPHTAVAVFAARAYVKRTADNVPLVVASTAHWAKFPGPVLSALKPEVYRSIPQDVDALTLVQSLHNAVGVEVHPALQVAVDAIAAQGDAVSVRRIEKNDSVVVSELFNFASVA